MDDTVCLFVQKEVYPCVNRRATSQYSFVHYLSAAFVTVFCKWLQKKKVVSFLVAKLQTSKY